MKAFFDDGGGLVVAAENNTDMVALRHHIQTQGKLCICSEAHLESKAVCEGPRRD